MHLYKLIRDDIVSGDILAGTKLPSKRGFAKNIGVSVVTVENAYAQLMSEGYIYSVPKKGFFAAEIERRIQSEKKNPVIVTPPDIESYFVDFSGNRTDPANFPFATWAKLMREIISQKSNELMVNAPSGGIPELRQAISEHLREFRGIEADPNHIVIGAGTEYLYNLLIQLIGFDKVYAMEDPGHKKVSQTFEIHGVRCEYISMDSDGVDPDKLEKSGADVLHISPSHHFPTGINTPAARRYALLHWASSAPDRYIIEDDYDSEFRFFGKPIPTLQSMDTSGSVIYMNTFTKSLASTIRISYMVLPPSLAKEFYDRLGFYSCTVSNLEQYTLAKFISDGYFEKHINRMRTRYKLKKDILLAEMKNSGLLNYAEICHEDSGLHFLIRMKKWIDPEIIKREACKEKIRLSCISDYYHNAGTIRTPEFVISYSAIQDFKIPLAAQELVTIIERAMELTSA